MEFGLRQSSRFGSRPDSAWAVDWANFFAAPDNPSANLAHRIGPHYQNVLSIPSEMPSKLAAAGEIGEDISKGLALRDMLSAAYSGLWSVPSLLVELRSRLAAQRSPLAGMLPDYGTTWRQPIRDWLAADWFGLGDSRKLRHLDPLADDPPLPFFVLFEAAHAFVDGRPRCAEAGNCLFPGLGGRTLGPFGSIILAETFYPALRRGPRLSTDESKTVASRIEASVGKLAVATAGMADVAILADLWRSTDGSPRDLSSMWSLIEFLREQVHQTEQR